MLVEVLVGLEAMETDRVRGYPDEASINPPRSPRPAERAKRPEYQGPA